MPDEVNGRISLAVLSTKLDTLIDKVGELYDTARQDHDDLIAIKGQVEDITWWKRAIIGLILSNLATAAGVIYAIIQHFGIQ